MTASIQAIFRPYLRGLLNGPATRQDALLPGDAMDSDFNQLYAQLRLRPDCTLDEFKRAYRRRVAELHPDRRPEEAGQVADSQATALSELTSLYTTATRFHRAHGRLPGAPPRPRVAMNAAAEPRSRHPHRSRSGELDAATPQKDSTSPPHRTRFAALIVLVVLALIVILEVTTPDRAVPEAIENAGAMPGDSPAEANAPVDPGVP